MVVKQFEVQAHSVKIEKRAGTEAIIIFDEEWRYEVTLLCDRDQLAELRNAIDELSR